MHFIGMCISLHAIETNYFIAPMKHILTNYLAVYYLGCILYEIETYIHYDWFEMCHAGSKSVNAEVNLLTVCPGTP